MHGFKPAALSLALATLLLAGCDADDDSDFDPVIEEPPVDAANACSSPGPGAGAPLSAGAAAVPPGGADIAVVPAFEALAFNRPLALKFAPDSDDCVFVVEQGGVVRAFANDQSATASQVFIDITDRVDSEPFEAGLLGLAFHPDYATNGQVFLSYTGNNGELVSYVSRFTTTDNGATLDPASEEILLTLTQPFLNHNGGNIEFGPDGFLYIGFGDGGSANDPNELAQNTLNLFGALLRIDVDGGVPYGIPATNPFAGNELCSLGNGAADCPEIYAWGLRNPWRWTFDRETAEIWLGDVGQSAIEEVDVIDLGGNYGWPFFEGTRCNTQAPVVDCGFAGIPPVTEYGRAAGRSVTGGYVYRGTEIPDLVGVYVYGDFASGAIFQYFDAGNGNVITRTTDTGLAIASFAETPEGELYVVDLLGGGIHRIVAN